MEGKFSEVGYSTYLLRTSRTTITNNDAAIASPANPTTARRNDPRGVVEGVAAVLWLLAVAEQREVRTRLREQLGLATEIDLKALLPL
ncbi:MAG TPA: hypothetical protein VKA82_08580 [Rubrobacter sp.]|nr:hypothetical protein [Rubrobacter sp.]